MRLSRLLSEGGWRRIGWGSQRLEIDLSSVVCVSPVNTGPEHSLELAVQAILEQRKIPYEAGSDTGGLVTPAGAAILAALAPEFVPSDRRPSDSKRIGLGLGQHILDAAQSFGALRLLFALDHPLERTIMSVKHTHEIKAKVVEASTGTTMRVLIPPEEGPHFAMRRFVMQPGGGIPNHTNLVEHEQYVLNGRAKIGIGDETFDVQKGDVVFIPAQVPHWYQNIGEEPFEFLCLVLNKHDSITILE